MSTKRSRNFWYILRNGRSVSISKKKTVTDTHSVNLVTSDMPLITAWVIRSFKLLALSCTIFYACAGTAGNNALIYFPIDSPLNKIENSEIRMFEEENSKKIEALIFDLTTLLNRLIHRINNYAQWYMWEEIYIFSKLSIIINNCNNIIIHHHNINMMLLYNNNSIIN